MNWCMMKQSSNLSSYSLDGDFSTTCIGKSQPKNKHVSLNMDHPADLNQYTAATLLVTILTDDAIKDT